MTFTGHHLRRTLILASTMLLAACGGGGSADRTVEVEMVDNAFKPATLSAATGETVRFRFTNRGSVAHDAFIGEEQEQAEHAEEMEAESGEHQHGGEGITVDPGDTGELTYTFGDAGEIFVGCHQPGHYEAGMKATITVS